VQQAEDFIALKPFVTEVDNFVGWSKRSPCLDRLQEFDAVVAAMVKDGTAERALKENIAAWKRAPVMTRE